MINTNTIDMPERIPIPAPGAIQQAILTAVLPGGISPEALIESVTLDIEAPGADVGERDVADPLDRAWRRILVRSDSDGSVFTLTAEGRRRGFEERFRLAAQTVIEVSDRIGDALAEADFAHARAAAKTLLDRIEGLRALAASRDADADRESGS